MKTLILSVGLMAATTATLASIQVKPDPDKPPRLYVKAYTEEANGSGLVDNYTCDTPPVLFIMGDEHFSESCNWVDAGGGSYSWICHEIDYWANIYGFLTNDANFAAQNPPSSWPARRSDPNNGFTVPVTQESCDVNFSKADEQILWDNTLSEEQINTRRTAQAVMKLQTGGKAMSHMRHLFALSGSATVSHPQYQYWDQEISELPGWTWQSDPPATNVPSQNISIGGSGKLGSDGNLWVTLPDNVDVDVTPFVAGADYYTFGVGATKYHPYITANGVDLDTNNPTFCVGQQVTFQLNGLPGAMDTMQGWTLPGKYVNQQTNYSSSCVTYVQNGSLLADNPTTNWFVNGSGGTVDVWQNLHFSNGQYVSVAAKGDITIFRPRILGHESISSGVVEVNTNDLSNIKLGMLSITPDYIHWTAEVEMRTNFPGTLSYTQLTDFEASYDIHPYCLLKAITTDSQYWLDNVVTYTEVHDPSGSIFSTNQGIFFADGPKIYGNFCSLAQLTPAFKTYLRFQPDGGIPVTLERAEWSEFGRTDFNGAIWSLTIHYTDGPHFYPDDSFPVWPQVFSN